MKREEIISYLKSSNPGLLYREADKVRKEYCGNAVHIRGIIEFSNYCKRDCCYCGLRKSNKNVTRYRMDEDQIIDVAIKTGELGYKTILLQSGEDDNYSVDSLAHIIKRIKTSIDCAVTLSIGEKNFAEYKQLRESGADRYLLRFETSDKNLFKKLKPDSSYDNRLSCLDSLRNLGYQVGSGIMVGLPGQSAEILADDILLMDKLSLDMIGIGPFLPHPDTPLCDSNSGTLDLTLKVLALIRIIMPDIHLPATTAVGSINKNGRQKALKCGANVIMPNVTPAKYRKYYEIYPNKICINEKPLDCRLFIESMLKSLGREIAKDYGDSLRRMCGV